MRKMPVQKRPTRKLLGAVVAVALLLPNVGFTLGLGEIEVNSALNQKLNADIELLSASPEDTETLIIKLASRKEFTRAGLDRPYSLNDLRFKSVIIDDVPHIKVSSGSPIREPFLNFLVEIDWPNGHLLREYTVLLDPPVFMTQAASVATSQSGGAQADASFRPGAGSTSNVVPVATPDAPASIRPAATMQAPVNQPPQAQAMQPSTTWVPSPVIQQSNTLNQAAGSYKVKAGDTAWSLADAMRPDQSITVPQMMIAMLRANPESFINENINGLKRGYILRIPDYDQIASISNADAKALVREQAALWRQYQQSQSGGQPVSAMASDASGAAMGAGGGDGVAEDGAYLEIVSAGSGSSSISGKDPTQMSAQELRAELAFARERVETELVEKEALQQRIGTLQQSVDKMKGMLSIEDSELAEVQSLGQSNQQDVVEDEIQAEDVDSEMMQDVTAQALAEAEQAMSDEAGLDVTDTDEAGIDEAVVEGENTAEDALFIDETAVTEEPTTDDFVEPEMPVDSQLEPQIVKQEPADPLTQLLNNPMMLAAAGGGLLLIVALIGLIIKRRKSTAEESDVPAVVSGFDDLESLADDIADEIDDVEETVSLASEEIVGNSFKSESTMILDPTEDTVIADTDSPADSKDSDESRDDVIAEADVYLAYGIYQQAEELLSQAIADNPERDDYRVKLAETHYAGKNAEAFVKAAGDVKQRVDNDSASWKKIMAMGQELCADEPMFQGSAVAMDELATASSDTPEMDFDLGGDDGSDDLATNGNSESPDLGLSLDDDKSEGLLELSGLDEKDKSNDESEEVLEVADELEFDLSDAGAVEESETVDIENDLSLDIDTSELDIDDKDETTGNVEQSLDLSDADIGLAEVLEDTSDADLDFGLDDADKDVTAALDMDDEEISLDLTEEVTSLDMDMDDENTLLETAVEAETEIELVSDLEVADETLVVSVDIDDEDDFDLSSLDDVDEVGTKLDLARAYLDMGDQEGTKSILEEVIADGSDEQKQEANDLMAQLAG